VPILRVGFFTSVFAGSLNRSIFTKVLLVDALRGGLSGALNSFSAETMAVGVGFAELSGTGVGGPEVKDLRI
jgi:hypothetical protein